MYKYMIYISTKRCNLSTAERRVTTKLQLFKAAILPYLTSSQLVWHFCRASDRRKLERVLEGHSELFTVTDHRVMKNY